MAQERANAKDDTGTRIKCRIATISGQHMLTYGSLKMLFFAMLGGWGIVVLTCVMSLKRHSSAQKKSDCSGLVVRLLASYLGEPGSIPDGVASRFSYDDATVWRVFSGTSHFAPLLHFGAAPCSPLFNLMGSQDVDVKEPLNLFTPPFRKDVALSVCSAESVSNRTVLIPLTKQLAQLPTWQAARGDPMRCPLGIAHPWSTGKRGWGRDYASSPGSKNAGIWCEARRHYDLYTRPRCAPPVKTIPVKEDIVEFGKLRNHNGDPEWNVSPANIRTFLDNYNKLQTGSVSRRNGSQLQCITSIRTPGGARRVDWAARKVIGAVGDCQGARSAARPGAATSYLGAARPECETGWASENVEVTVNGLYIVRQNQVKLRCETQALSTRPPSSNSSRLSTQQLQGRADISDRHRQEKHGGVVTTQFTCSLYPACTHHVSSKARRSESGRSCRESNPGPPGCGPPSVVALRHLARCESLFHQHVLQSPIVQPASRILQDIDTSSRLFPFSPAGQLTRSSIAGNSATHSSVNSNS
ncbi:hypothetical protein PR048_030442 [Dryococelus australis]|uniref:Uncharacterized protein n=1 Tax=Dryococelus australis TaxID=614101 RepID=A0ABQ9GBK3_9NEOP|nr:hypothetical protein PR048_030442 [Dryococelus australis]